MPRKRSTTIPLEGKRKADEAWRDCEVSLTSTGRQTVLNVRYHGLEDNEDDNILTANEARARLRPQSKMLEKGQCLQLQEGDIVVASRRSESGKFHFFDARIEKVERQQHSPRVSCKCSFELMWLDRKMKGDMCTVSASQIRHINQCNIQDHPIIFEWLKSVRPEDGHQAEPSDIGSDVQAQLEEEIDKITMMADTLNKDYLVEVAAKSLAEPADVRQSSRRKAPARKRSGKGTLESTAEVPQVRTSSRKRAQSNASAVSEDETILLVPSPFDKRPRLSPLAARAALAAAVQTMPLGRPICGTSPMFSSKPLEKQTEKNAGSTRRRLNSRSLVEDDESKITKSLSEIHTAREAQERGKRATRRGATEKQDCSRRSASVSYAGPNILSPIKESLLENQWEIPSENVNVIKVIAPSVDILDNNMLRERTNRTSIADEQEYLATKETTEFAAKKARRKGEISSLRSSSRLRKETNISASPRPELNEEMHSTAETTDNNAIQPKAEAIETEGGVSSGINRTKKSASARLSRSKLSSQAIATMIEGQSEVDNIGLSKAEERRAVIEVTSADDKVQDIKTIERKKDGSRKRQPIKKTHPNKKSKTANHEPSCSEMLQLEEDDGQTTLREKLTLPAAMIDVTVELVTDIQNNGEIGENSSPPRLKLRTRKVSFDALPVGFGLGITGWMPSPGRLQSQHSPAPCEVDLEGGNTVDLHIEAADMMNTAMKQDGENMNTERKKAAAFLSKTQDTGERLEGTSPGASNDGRLASKVGKKVTFASVLVQSSPCYGGKVQAFSSEIEHQLGGEVIWSSSPACVNPGKKSANSIRVSVYSGQNDPSEDGATSVATVKRGSAKRSRGASPSAILSVEQGLETTHHPTEEKDVRRASGRPAKRSRKIPAV